MFPLLRFRDDDWYAIEKANPMPIADTLRAKCFRATGRRGNHPGANGRKNGSEYSVLAEP